MDNKDNIVHQVSIFDRKKMDIVGAVEVLSSTEKEVHIKLQDGFMKITGERLTIQKLIPNEFLLSLSGEIGGIGYSSRLTKKSFFKKVFK
ncbi:MAG: YabP/YqfC family sporulation protein [Clostridia bacterium]|nr:YabP/YqfC family sporulation protein [Clostridia bacterium]